MYKNKARFLFFVFIYSSLLIFSNALFGQNSTSKNQNDNGMMMGHKMMENGTMHQHMMMSNVAQENDTTGNWKAPVSASKIKNPLAGIEKATKEGENIFNQDCTPCHGNEGKGDGPTATLLDHKPADLTSAKVQSQSDGALFWKITTGKDDMSSFKKSLTDKQRWEVVDYVRLLENKNGNKKK
jgi:mono/diheme cytochrome c family protein